MRVVLLTCLLNLVVTSCTATLKPLTLEAILPKNHLSNLLQEISHIYYVIRSTTIFRQADLDELSQLLLNLVSELRILRSTNQSSHTLRWEDIAYLADLLESIAIEFQELANPDDSEAQFIKRLFKQIHNELYLLMN